MKQAKRVEASKPFVRKEKDICTWTILQFFINLANSRNFFLEIFVRLILSWIVSKQWSSLVKNVWSEDLLEKVLQS